MAHANNHTGLDRAGAAPREMLHLWNWELCLGCIAVMCLTGFPILGALIAAVLNSTSPHLLLVCAIGGAYGLVAGVATPMLLLGSAWIWGRHAHV